LSCSAARDELLARAALAQQQHREVAVDDAVRITASMACIARPRPISVG
jgi:hypothetical protein